MPRGKLQLELSKSQVAYSELVEPFFRENVDFSKEGLAATYWPMGRGKPILLDAARAFGRPIVQRSGTPSSCIRCAMQAKTSTASPRGTALRAMNSMRQSNTNKASAPRLDVFFDNTSSATCRDIEYSGR